MFLKNVSFCSSVLLEATRVQSAMLFPIVYYQFVFESLTVFAWNTILVFLALIVEGRAYRIKGEYRGLGLSDSQCMNIWMLCVEE